MMSLSHNSEQLIQQWLSTLRHHTSSNLHDDPRYYLYRPQSLITTSHPQRFLLGTGQQVCASLVDAFRTVQHEILFVTCFWAPSASQAALAQALRALSARAVAAGRHVRVRIGFSSCSLWQKLTQTASLSAKEWPPSTWPATFGLPALVNLPGLDITVKSIFALPLSLMHSKFVILDRERLFWPSCNVSWEDWFEGCIELRGEIVGQTLLFWENFWGRDGALPPLQTDLSPVAECEASSSALHPDAERGVTASRAPNSASQVSLLGIGKITTIFLPSPHHRNPCFRPSPFFRSAPPPPPTPLNTFLLTAFGAAERSIYIQSANVTSQPALDAILAALQRGVNVQIMSNQRMQTLEQILTAGRLTEWALEDLWRAYSKSKSLNWPAIYADGDQDLEAGPSEHGNLEISYFQPPPRRPDDSTSSRHRPGKSHLKLTVVDDEIVVLGSGNMDRASWYTSQELGVAFFSRQVAEQVMRAVREELVSCIERAH